jgi:hypothetical protein
MEAQMSKKISLPSGATVTFKDPNSLRIKDRKKVMRVTDEAEGGDLSKAMALTDALLAMLIEDWSFDLIIPSVKVDTLGELTMEDYDFLVEETKDAQKSLFPKLGQTEETEADPKAPTDNLNA